MRGIQYTLLAAAFLSMIAFLHPGKLAAAPMMMAGPATMPATKPTTMPTKPPAIGDHAADFSLKDLAGKTVQLADLTKNGPVVLLQLRGWVGYQCPYCTAQAADFISHRAALEAAGGQIVMVYPGRPNGLAGHAQEFVDGKDLPATFHFLLDPDMVFVNSYGLRWNKAGETAYPSTFVIDRTGVVRFAKISHDHGDRATSDEVLAVLKTLK